MPCFQHVESENRKSFVDTDCVFLLLQVQQCGVYLAGLQVS